MQEPSTGEWPWVIEHRTKTGNHAAWYQRAMVAGDFSPGKRPLPNYVLKLDGEVPDLDQPPTCGTCGKVPRVEDLTPVERSTGLRNFLDAFRSGRKEWPAGTDPTTCFYCNHPYRGQIVMVPAGIILRADSARPVEKSSLVRATAKTVPVCERCAKFLPKVVHGREVTREAEGVL